MRPEDLAILRALYRPTTSWRAAPQSSGRFLDASYGA